jgi:hypothetical protein
VAPYTPLKVAVSTTLHNDCGFDVYDEDIENEYKNIQEFCDNAISEKLASL